MNYTKQRKERQHIMDEQLRKPRQSAPAKRPIQDNVKLNRMIATELHQAGKTETAIVEKIRAISPGAPSHIF